MNEPEDIRELTFPARFERRFSLQLYWSGHGVLLLRSAKSQKDPRRIDILFRGVIWMALPAWCDSLEISVGSVDAIPFQVPARLKSEVQYHRVYRVTTDEVDHFVVAGSASLAEDDREYGQQSLLLPDLHVKEVYPSFCEPKG